MPNSVNSTDSARNSRSPSTSTSAGSLPEYGWHDETKDFSMLAVRKTLRAPNVRPRELVKTYTWYPDAVPVDSLLPPGISLSIKELCVYYPHHVRWQDIMLRLSHNDYRGPDILGIQTFFRGDPQDHMSPTAMNQIQRDTVQRLLPGFKTVGYAGKGDSNIYTVHLSPGTYLEKKFKGYVVPTFDDLLRGLTSLPRGEDARGFTQCLAWYLDICSTFTPKLNLNVLHAQALIRALRQPLKPIVSPNLNQLALKQWREDGRLPTIENAGTEYTIRSGGSDKYLYSRRTKVQAVFNIHHDPVNLKMHIDVPIRHILTFPFLALHGVVADALSMGLDKAEHQRAVRKSVVAPAKPTPKVRPTRETDLQCTPKRQRYDSCDVNIQSLQNFPLKRARSSEYGTNIKVALMPERPTVSPITPRTLTGHRVWKRPTK